MVEIATDADGNPILTPQAPLNPYLISQTPQEGKQALPSES
jgi:hypothetical protein